MSLTIRPYQPSDAAAWLAVRAESYSRSQFNDQIEPVREQYPEADFGYASVVELVAELDGRLVGLIDAGVFNADRTQGDLYVQNLGTGSYIEVVAVAPATQGQGVGRALLTACLAALRERGAAFVEIFTRSDEPANRLYQGIGAVEIAHSWRVLGTRRDAPAPHHHWHFNSASRELEVTDDAGQRLLYRAEQPQWFTVFTAAALDDFDIEVQYRERTYFLKLN
ncbi:GNAT family N-acetyltransferase [Lacticaseibacillus parakribbianus]|uniref:GNAT family N-acetyltransferase n=1 Tax=Lacticaseibacillus parakribbianus TaxID=2970927 RepID=UPI0021CB41BA|nr:GNAT family N-acetyltransferase [Lacticaseibacillus parakribbianus]